MQRRFESRRVVNASAATLALVATFAACVTDSVGTVDCVETNLRCPPRTVCAVEGNRCDPEGCGDGRVDRGNGEDCDDGNLVDGDGCSGDCRTLESCGDGKLDAGETCDDRNTESGDGCSSDCQSTETCGDKIVNSGEQCDLGTETDKCDDDCTFAECGDGNFNPFAINPATGKAESCDRAGNASDCDADCTEDECGDGLHNAAAGEECDDGENGSDTDECISDCKRARCGDHHIWAGVEGCDDGNKNNADSCPDGVVGTCQPARCGDGHVKQTPEADGQTPMEDCDDGNDNVFDVCPSGPGGNCRHAVCGDGFLRLGFEQCEPASTPFDPQCDPDCTLPACGDEIRNEAAGEQCDDGNRVNTDECPDGPGGTCQNAHCGDGFVRLGEGNEREECDNGYVGNSAVCNVNCTLPDCGDGILNTAAGEACDDNNDVQTDGCPSGIGGTCQGARCGDGFIHDGVEDCDDGNGLNFDDCPDGPRGTCEPARCGDGLVRLFFEQCDDDNEITTDACPSGPAPPGKVTCQPARCGDGFLWSGVEQCEPQNGADNADCNGVGAPAGAACHTPRCGDGHVNTAAGEECDNTPDPDDNDGCPSGKLCNHAGDAGVDCECI